jgi:hypothetical protein
MGFAILELELLHDGNFPNRRRCISGKTRKGIDMVEVG